MKKRKINSIQQWLPFEKILDQGIIKIKEGNYVKIIQINPINYNLKSNLEKEAIFNSYKIFLNTCDFNLQILIQSKKENLNQIIYNLKNQMEKEINSNILDIFEEYLNYIQITNKKINFSSKNFYIIYKNSNINEKNEENIKNELKEKYFKIKENLIRCGNEVKEIKNEKEIKIILNSFIKNNIK